MLRQCGAFHDVTQVMCVERIHKGAADHGWYLECSVEEEVPSDLQHKKSARRKRRKQERGGKMGRSIEEKLTWTWTPKTLKKRWLQGKRRPSVQGLLEDLLDTKEDRQLAQAYAAEAIKILTMRGLDDKYSSGTILPTTDCILQAKEAFPCKKCLPVNKTDDLDGGQGA